MTDWDKRVSDAAEKCSQAYFNAEGFMGVDMMDLQRPDGSFTAGANWAREEFAKQYRELLDENIQLGHELIDLRQQCEAMASSLAKYKGMSAPMSTNDWPNDTHHFYADEALAQYQKFKEGEK